MRMDDGSTRLLKESSDIIDELMAATQAASVGDAAEQKQWRAWVDEKWVRVVTVNIYRTVGESLQTFDYMTSLGYLIQSLCTDSVCGSLCRALSLSLSVCLSRCVCNVHVSWPEQEVLRLRERIRQVRRRATDVRSLQHRIIINLN